PQLSIQKFACTLCDLQLTHFPPHLCKHLSTVYDVYLEICQKVNKSLNSKLGRDSVDWQLKNACVAYTYLLEDEPVLTMSCMSFHFLLIKSLLTISSAKYLLALIDHLVGAFNQPLLIGYDIGCGFSATANCSQLLGSKLCDSGSRFCVGSFHGHAHCRSCQLDWHPLHVEGAGLDDFEG
ncbi:hypothetical protein M422DRAFT_128332, partial [Sphaerobolus stellatus SS14]